MAPPPDCAEITLSGHYKNTLLTLKSLEIKFIITSVPDLWHHKPMCSLHINTEYNTVNITAAFNRIFNTGHIIKCAHYVPHWFTLITLFCYLFHLKADKHDVSIRLVNIEQCRASKLT